MTRSLIFIALTLAVVGVLVIIGVGYTAVQLVVAPQ